MDVAVDNISAAAVAPYGGVAGIVVAAGGGGGGIAVAVDHRRCHAPYGSNSVVDIYGNNCVQLCGRFIQNVTNEKLNLRYQKQTGKELR